MFPYALWSVYDIALHPLPSVLADLLPLPRSLASSYMVIVTLQQIIDERISFLKEQINPENKPQVNWTFQIQIDAIMSVDYTEKIEAIITQKKALLKNSKDVYESEKIFSEHDDLEWLQRQIARYS
jgi:hypothetical protein